MERKLKNHAVVGICALGLIGLNSCLKVDETYDLDKDFDMTITVGGDLTVPGSSTEKIVLGDLLDLEENEVIKSVNGNYHLQQQGDPQNTTVNVPEVSLTMDKQGSFSEVSTPVTIPPFSGIGTELPSEEVEFDQNIDINVSEGDITSVIKSINEANTSCEDTYIVFSLDSHIATAKINKGYRIEFPDYITVEALSYGWEASEDGHALVLNKEEGEEITSNTEIRFQITGIDFVDTDAKYDYAQHTITLGGSIKLNGKITATATSNAGGNVVINASVKSKMLHINSVTAKVDPEVDIKDYSISLDGMPEFLSDNVEINLTDPRIYITLRNPSPVSVKMTAKLYSYKTGKETQSVGIPVFTIPANTDDDYPDGYTICINQTGEGEEDGVDKYITIPGLSNIIKYIPETIKIDDIVTEVVQEDITVVLGEDYEILTDYKVDTPLQFGGGTKIEYTENLDGWDADLEDMEFNSVEASMTVTNAIPLGIKLTGVAIDKNGNPLENVTVSLNMNISAGSPENPTKQEVEFTITTQDGSIKGLDGIKLTVIASASENTSDETLNENQYMQFEDIKLGLKGGITMDLN